MGGNMRVCVSSVRRRSLALLCCSCACIARGGRYLRNARVARAERHEDHCGRGRGGRRIQAGKTVLHSDAGAVRANCRRSVASPAASTPTADSNIAFEVWLPVAGWNGKLVAVGNGGYSGEIWFPFMARAARRRLCRRIDRHRSRKLAGGRELRAESSGESRRLRLSRRARTRVKAKAISVAFYGSPPRRAYWNGCSTGGRQGLTEAQRYPTDFDGIVAGAPANYMTRLSAKYVVGEPGDPQGTGQLRAGRQAEDAARGRARRVRRARRRERRRHRESAALQFRSGVGAVAPMPISRRASPPRRSPARRRCISRC